MIGRINSIQSLGTVDGPGLRAVVFAQGCPLRCIYCHNPDTWDINGGEAVDSDELAERIIRLSPYIKDGGVTFSGGEPLLQAEFFTELAKRLSEAGLHIALDTSGCIINERVTRLLRYTDLVLLDVKFTSEEGYKKRTGGSLRRTVEFLELLSKMDKPVWIRQVIVPGINDTENCVLELKALTAKYRNIKKYELLPFKKLCVPKYESLGIEFPLNDTPACDNGTAERLLRLLTK